MVNYTREWARQFAYEGGAGILPADGRARFMDRDVDPSTYAPDFADAAKNRWPLTRGGTAKRCPRAATALGAALLRAASRAPRVKGQYAGGWGYESPAGDGFPGAPGALTLASVNPNLPPIRLMHVGARWYDPSLGRFIQRDPIGLVGGFNIYTYVLGNPLVRIDPSGLASIHGGLRPEFGEMIRKFGLAEGIRRGIIGLPGPKPPGWGPVTIVVCTGVAIGVGAAIGLNAATEAATGTDLFDWIGGGLAGLCPDCWDWVWW